MERLQCYIKDKYTVDFSVFSSNLCSVTWVVVYYELSTSSGVFYANKSDIISGVTKVLFVLAFLGVSAGKYVRLSIVTGSLTIEYPKVRF